MNLLSFKISKFQNLMTRRLAILLGILGLQLIAIAVTNATAATPNLQTTYTCASSELLRFSDSEGKLLVREIDGTMNSKRAPHMNQNLVVGENDFLLRPFIYSDQSGRKTLEIYQSSPEYGFQKVDELDMGTYEAQEAQVSLMAREATGGKQMVFCRILMEWL